MLSTTLERSQVRCDWSNKDNRQIYENMPIEHFKLLAEKVGFPVGQEIDFMFLKKVKFKSAVIRQVLN